MSTYLVDTLIERYVTGSWLDISAYVVSDIEGEYMIASNEPTDLLAGIGEVSFTMNNGNGNFSPNSAFKRGTPIRITTTYDGIPKIKFLGTILDLDPDTLEWGDQYVRVTAVDWMNFAVNYPMIIPEIQQGLSVEDAVAYLLSLIQKQPERVTYYEGREEFDFVFDTINEQTRLYSELNKLALSEFAPIYLRAGNNLVVESANTRHGMRTLTQIPVRPSDLHAILTDPNGGLIIKVEGTNFAILADELYAPNLVSGTFRPLDVDIEHGKNLINQATVRAYPSRVDTVAQTLFQLETPILVPTLSTIQIKGTWANPDGGGLINANNIIPMVTGTNYQAFVNRDGSGVERTSNLYITERYGAEGFNHTVFNATKSAWITKFTIQGYGLYPYNPIDAMVSVTGSISEYGNSYSQIDQKYQDDYTTGVRIAETITEDEKAPRNQLLSVTFDASTSPEAMQASQYMDIGDLTWITNVKPAMDTYAYIQGKKFIITPAGIVTETWYLKEMDSLRKGLQMVSLFYPNANGTQCGVDFSIIPHLANLSPRTISGWVYNNGSPPTQPPIAKYDGEAGWWMFQLGAAGVLEYRENRSVSDGIWRTPTGTVSANSWYHFAVAYDNSSDQNTPMFYVNGVQVPLDEVVTPSGDVSDDSNANLTLGNVNFPSFAWFYTHHGKQKDMRIYNKMLLASEVKQLYNNPNDLFVVTDGLVFQAPCIKSEDYGNLTGTVMYPESKLIDNIYGIRGTPHWNIPSGTAIALRIGDPTI